jgi:hypothetical protein
MNFKSHPPRRLAVAAMLALAPFAASTFAAVPPVTPEGFESSTWVGYQAWFNVPSDGTGRNWTHWGTTNPLQADKMSIDMWPDTSEYPASALQDTGFKQGNGQAAKAYSSYNEGAIDKHFEWMQKYNVSGAILQWFILEPAAYRLDISKRVQASAEKYGRGMFIEFDISGTKGRPTCGDGPKLVECIQSRWKSAVDAGVTASPAYKRFKNKPLVAIYGIGFDNNDHLTAADAAALIRWFHTDAPAAYRASVMGGLPAGWRTNSDDAIGHDTAKWQQNYASLDIISPWTVGRYADDAGATYHIQGRVGADMALVRSRNQRYLPVIFPGFSWNNLNGGPRNQIPRRGGQFLYTQARENAALGATGYFVAMFDEVDEGTAIFKTAATSATAPKEFYTLQLDDDRIALPSDWYLQVNRTVVDATKQPGMSGFLTTTLPMSFKAGALTMPAGTSKFGGPFSFNYQNDGNLVIYDAASNPLWASNTTGHSCTASTCSAVFQADGNFVLKQGSTVYWSTKTSAAKGRLTVTSAAPFIQVLAEDGTPMFTTSEVLSSPYQTFNLRPTAHAWFKGGRLSYQLDGNLVVYDDAGAPLWATNTANRSCTSTTCLASFTSDGNFGLYQNGVAYWTTGTAGSAAVRINASAAVPYLSLTASNGLQLWPAE